MVALAVGKTYLTAGGYVVEIINNELHSSERTAPGVTRSGRNALEINKDPTNTCKDGWYYNPNGTVQALNSEWTEKLRIVEELPFPIPKLPEGYEWADGFPQFREIKRDEYYISNSYHTNPSYERFLIHFAILPICSMSSPSNESKFGKRRFAVVKKATATSEPTKDVDPLIAKYGEPEAGWRWLADDEKIEKGDEYTRPHDKKFVESRNYTTTCQSQTDVCKPYRRKIMTQSQQLGDPIITDSQVKEKAVSVYPRYYKHKDDGFVGNIKYIKRTNEANGREHILKDGTISVKDYSCWDSNCDSYVKKGVWVEVTALEVDDFIASIGEAQVGEWVECIDNSGYSDKLTVGRKYQLQRPTERTCGHRFYQIIAENVFSVSGWKVSRFKKTSPPTPAAPVEPEMVVITDPSHVLRSCDYIRRADNTGWNKIDSCLLIGCTIKSCGTNCVFACEPKDHPDEEIVEITDRFHIGRSCDFIKQRDSSDWNPLVLCVGKSINNEPRYILGCKRKDLPQKKEEIAMKFPIYYRGKRDFLNDCKYVKRTSESSFNIIQNDGTTRQFEYTWDFISHDTIVKRGDWIEVPEKEVLDFIASVTVTEANPTLVKKEEIEMKKETLVKIATGSARFAGNWSFKAANYFFFETAANIARPILRSARYAVFLGSLSAAVYGYNHPDVVKNAIKSCLPKITIEAPEVLKG